MIRTINAVLRNLISKLDTLLRLASGYKRALTGPNEDGRTIQNGLTGTLADKSEVRGLAVIAVCINVQ